MENLMVIFWIAVFATTLIVEACTTALVSIWFSAGALAALILALFQMPEWLQFLIFAAVSLVLFLFCRKKLEQYFTWNRPESSPYAGKTAEVTSDISRTNPGRVLMEGKDWRAAALRNETFVKGETVTVVTVKGATLYVVSHHPEYDIRY